MKNIFLILTIFCFLTTCSSETEKKGITEIAELYGCSVAYSIGTSLSTSDSNKKYFELTISEGENLNLLEPEIVGSGSAIIFYKNLTTEEKENYTHINTVVEQRKENGKVTNQYEYPTEQLNLVQKKMKLLDQTVTHFQNEDYTGMLGLFDPIILQDLDQETFLLQLDSIDEKFGKINGHQFYGFEFYKTDHNGEQLDILTLYSLLMGSIQNLNLQVSVAPEPKHNKILGVHQN